MEKLAALDGRVADLETTNQLLSEKLSQTNVEKELLSQKVEELTGQVECLTGQVKGFTEQAEGLTGQVEKLTSANAESASTLRALKTFGFMRAPASAVSTLSLDDSSAATPKL